MRLSQVYLRQYGPVRKDLELAEGLTVVRGPNESGKSLLVEGLLTMLAPGAVPNRVLDESPEGFVELTDGTGRHRVDGDTSFAEICDEAFGQDVRPEELRNVFVVRAGDLGFHERDDFYTHVTDRLTGRRVEDVERVIDALREEGRLTERRLDISSDQRYDSAGDQVQAARDLRGDVRDYLATAAERGVDRVESEYYAAASRAADLARRLETLEAARHEREKRERHEQLADDLGALRETTAALDDLPDAETLAALDDRAEDLADAAGAAEARQSRERGARRLARWSLAGGALAFAALVLAGFPLAGLVATVLFLGAAGYFWWTASRLSAELADLGVAEERLLADARGAGLEVDGRDGIRAALGRARSRREALEADVQGVRAVLERDLDVPASAASSALAASAASAASVDRLVQRAERQLEALEADVDDDLADEFDPGELATVEQAHSEAEARQTDLRERLEHHRRTLETFRERAHEVRFETFTDRPLDLELENLGDLDALVDRLDAFVETIETGAEASRVAIDVFEDIREDERQQTAELFEEGSRATALFREITDGRYGTVSYDTAANTVSVVKATGEAFTPAQLSDGTRDQLYLAIRVALGERLLGGEPGFFVMDDAFLTSDPHRLEAQADLVERLVAEGWQVVYLSSKEDAIEALASRTPNDVVELSPLE